MDLRLTWTDCYEAGDYVVPYLLSPRDLVFRPDNMDENVLHSVFAELPLHRVPRVKVPIRRTARCVHVIPTNDKKGNVFGHQTFPRLSRGSNLILLVPEASTVTTELPRYLSCLNVKPQQQQYIIKSINRRRALYE